MRQKSIFLALSALLVIAWGLLLFVTYRQGGTMLFYAAEGVTLVTLLFLIYFYRKVIKPLDTIAMGMNLLREQDFSSRLSPVGQREADRIVEIFNRMMEQLKDERLRLREQNHFLDLLVNASPMGVIILDFDERITMMNPAAKNIIGQGDNCMGARLCDIKTPLMKEIAAVPQEQTRTIRLNGTAVYSVSRLSFRDRGFAHPFVLLELLTEELHKAERNAYEKVIRMIAHEVNNTMGGITSTLQTAGMMMKTITADTLNEDSADIVEALDVCEERGYMLAQFITRFAEVVKIPQPQRQPYDLNESARYCARFMQKLCGEHDIELRLRLADGTVPVYIDVALFEQVLVNIVKNAVESIGYGGFVEISTSNNPASIVIADNGHGVAGDVSRQIFTPFFTTKSNGQGIGLMFTREVLSAHGCLFSLETGEDGITRFTIRWS